MRLRWLILMLVMVVLPWPVAAQEPFGPEAAESRLTLDEFVNEEQTLYGPYDARYIALRLPANWQLEPGGELQFDIDTFIGGNQTTNAVSGTVGFGGFLSVTFNDAALGQIVLDQPGPQTFTMTIPPEALTTTHPEGNHIIGVSLDAGLHCNDPLQTNVVIRSSSRIILPHQLSFPLLDLQNLPRPIYQNLPDLTKETPTALVVPDAPSATELQAAMIVAAAFGQQTFNKLPLEIVPASKLNTVRSDSHVIFIGRIEQFEALSEVRFSAPLDAPTLGGIALNPDDGIVQIAPSPWNPERVVLFLGGSSDTGALKAAQALSADTIETAGDPSLAVVAEVRSTDALTNAIDLNTTREFTSGLPLAVRLLDLGYPTRNAFGIGAHYLDYTFTIPNGVEMAEAGTFELQFSHSNLLNFDVSGLLARLNDQPIGSVRFSEESAQGSTIQLRIPKSALQTGTNTLLLTADLVPNTPCIDPNLAGVWFAVQGDSRLTLPLREANPQQRTAPKLNSYPEALLRDRTLNNLAFVVPADDAVAWDIAARFIAELANRVNPELFEFRVVFPDQVTPELEATYDLVLIGQPKALPPLAAWGNALPMPFDANSNLPRLGNDRVVYRLPDNLSRGYLQITRSPNNPQRIVLAILGSDDESLGWAGRALLLGRLRSQLDGTAAVINDEFLSVEDTSLLNDTGTLAETMVPGDAQPTVFRESLPVERPRWILYAISVAFALTGLILTYVGVRALRNRRRNRV